MLVFGLELTCQVVQIIVATIAVGLLTVISLLKFYASVTCTRYRKMDDMKGKTVIITGGNGGIGRETAREIARRGARIILACRNIETADQVREEIIKETKNEQVIVKKLDLASRKSIREFAKEILNTEQRLDVLLHNAGIAMKKVEFNEDDLEMTMVTNHFGPFLLTHLLIDLLKKSAPSRIVVVASELYRLANLNNDNLNPRSSWFPPYIYYISKYANICFTRELARRLEGSGVTANCLHPGLVDTGIWESAPTLIKYPFKLIIKGFFKTPVQGCQTSVYAACSEDLKDVTGKYFMECKERGLSSGARDDDKAKKLWESSAKLINLQESDPKI